MQLEQFVEKMVEGLKRRAEDGVKIWSAPVWKNNDTRKAAVYIQAKDSNAAPTIYMEEFYRRYQDGAEIEELVSEIWNFYLLCRIPEEELMEMADWERMKDNVRLVLLNQSRNANRLASAPVFPVLDLVIACGLFITTQDGHGGQILIEESHLPMWQIDEGELFATAMENMQKTEAVTIRPMWHILHKLVRKKMETETGPDRDDMAETLEQSEKEEDLQPHPLYVLSNDNQYMGASGILCPGVLQNFARQRQMGKCYLIPSSIHEFLLLPLEDACEAETLQDMIREVNEVAVLEEEQLSDHLYLYDAENDRISLVGQQESVCIGEICQNLLDYRR